MYRVLTTDLSFLLHSDAHTGKIKDVSMHPEDCNTFVSIDERGALKAWDLSEYKPIYTGFPAKATEGTRVFIARDDRTALSGWADGFLRCFDFSNRAC